LSLDSATAAVQHDAMSKVEPITAALPVRRKALQDAFLSAAIAQRAPVVAYLRNGVKLEGRIVGYDAFQILIEGRGAVQLLYKSALATVVALETLNIHEDGGPPGDRSAAAREPRRPASRPRPPRRSSP
jgi:host factor-I protein